MANRLFKWEKVIIPILQQSAEARNDDKILYMKVLEIVDLCDGVQLRDYLMNRYDFPSYDTIARVRRRVQQMCPELRGSNHHERQKLQEEFIEYARQTA